MEKLSSEVKETNARIEEKMAAMVVDQVKLANKGLGEKMIHVEAMLERISRNQTGKETAFEVGQYSGSQPAIPPYQPFGTGVGSGTIPRRGSEPNFHPVFDEMYGDDWRRDRDRRNAINCTS